MAKQNKEESMRYVSSILLICLITLVSACSKPPSTITEAPQNDVTDPPAEWVVINNYSGSGAE